MDALTQAYQLELKKTRLAVSQHVGDMFKRLPNYYDNQVPGFVARAVPVVRAGQERAIALTSAYTTRKLQTSTVGLDVPSIVDNIRGGVTPEVVYARPFVTVRAAIYDIGIDQAIQKGLSRMVSTVDMDIMMASRDALPALADSFSDRVTGWTRVADSGCCDFCQMLDGVETGPTEPQPLHNNCGCTAEPITSSRPTESLSNGDVIDQVAIREHGELGPLITDKLYDFLSLDDFSSKALKQYQADIDA